MFVKVEDYLSQQTVINHKSIIKLRHTFIKITFLQQIDRKHRYKTFLKWRNMNKIKSPAFLKWDVFIVSSAIETNTPSTFTFLLIVMLFPGLSLIKTIKYTIIKTAVSLNLALMTLWRHRLSWPRFAAYVRSRLSFLLQEECFKFVLFLF